MQVSSQVLLKFVKFFEIAAVMDELVSHLLRQLYHLQIQISPTQT